MAKPEPGNSTRPPFMVRPSRSGGSDDASSAGVGVATEPAEVPSIRYALRNNVASGRIASASDYHCPSSGNRTAAQVTEGL